MQVGFTLAGPPCILQSRTFKCSLSNHRKAVYRSANAIFGKIGLIVSEDVILQLINSTCTSSLLYGVDACTLTKSVYVQAIRLVDRFKLCLNFKQAVREAATICPRPCKLLTFDILTLKVVFESRDVGYLCANFSLPRPLFLSTQARCT